MFISFSIFELRPEVDEAFVRRVFMLSLVLVFQSVFFALSKRCFSVTAARGNRENHTAGIREILVRYCFYVSFLDG